MGARNPGPAYLNRCTTPLVAPCGTFGQRIALTDGSIVYDWSGSTSNGAPPEVQGRISSRAGRTLSVPSDHSAGQMDTIHNPAEWSEGANNHYSLVSFWGHLCMPLRGITAEKPVSNKPHDVNGFLIHCV